MAEHTAMAVASEQATGDTVPSLRIGFTTDRKAVEFSINGKFSLYNNAGVALVRNVTATSSWHLHIELISPAEYYYNILIGKFGVYSFSVVNLEALLIAE